jgi:hypothetical protein
VHVFRQLRSNIKILMKFSSKFRSNLRFEVNSGPVLDVGNAAGAALPARAMFRSMNGVPLPAKRSPAKSSKDVSARSPAGVDFRQAD